MVSKAGILYPPPPAGEWLQYEKKNRWSLTNIWLNWTNGLLRLINSMATELIRPANYNPSCSQKLIKLEISFCRCSQLEWNGENDETGGYSALYTPLLPLTKYIPTNIKSHVISTNLLIYSYLYKAIVQVIFSYSLILKILFIHKVN